MTDALIRRKVSSSISEVGLKLSFWENNSLGLLMSEAHWEVLLYSLAYSLPTVLVFFLIVYATGSAILKAKRRAAGGAIGLAITWVFIGFILPFKSVKYYEDNINELFLMTFVVSVVVTIAVCKLSVLKSRASNQIGGSKGDEKL